MLGWRCEDKAARGGASSPGWHALAENAKASSPWQSSKRSFEEKRSSQYSPNAWHSPVDEQWDARDLDFDEEVYCSKPSTTQSHQAAQKHTVAPPDLQWPSPKDKSSPNGFEVDWSGPRLPGSSPKTQISDHWSKPKKSVIDTSQSLYSSVAQGISPWLLPREDSYHCTSQSIDEEYAGCSAVLSSLLDEEEKMTTLHLLSRNNLMNQNKIAPVHRPTKSVPSCRFDTNSSWQPRPQRFERPAEDSNPGKAWLHISPRIFNTVAFDKETTDKWFSSTSSTCNATRNSEQNWKDGVPRPDSRAFPSVSAESRTRLHQEERKPAEVLQVSPGPKIVYNFVVFYRYLVQLTENDVKQFAAPFATIGIVVDSLRTCCICLHSNVGDRPSTFVIIEQRVEQYDTSVKDQVQRIPAMCCDTCASHQWTRVSPMPEDASKRTIPMMKAWTMATSALAGSSPNRAQNRVVGGTPNSQDELDSDRKRSVKKTSTISSTLAHLPSPVANKLASLTDVKPQLRSLSFRFTSAQRSIMKAGPTKAEPKGVLPRDHAVRKTSSWQSTLQLCTLQEMGRALRRKLLQTLPTDLAFLVVTQVIPKSPVYQQGLRSGDLIVRLGDVDQQKFDLDHLRLVSLLTDISKQSLATPVECILLREGSLYMTKLQAMRWQHGVVLGAYINTYPLPQPQCHRSASSCRSLNLLGVQLSTP